MEWEGIPVRRSSRLQQDLEPILAPLTPPSSPDEEVVPLQMDDLPDMGPAVQIYNLPDTEIGFDGDYLASQEQHRGYYASEEEDLQSVNSDYDSESGGGLEEMLWPPEVLMHARNYGARGRKRKGGSREQQGADDGARGGGV